MAGCCSARRVTGDGGGASRVDPQVLLVDQFGFLFVFDIAKERLVLEQRLVDKPFVAVCYNTATDQVTPRRFPLNPFSLTIAHSRSERRAART
jgi:hypothetical protein